MVSGNSIEPADVSVNARLFQNDRSGLLSLPWRAPAAHLRGGPQVNGAGSQTELNWLLAQPDLPYVLQLMPAQQVVAILDELGLEDAAEIVEWVRGEQLIRVFDLELWSPAQNAEGALEISTQRFVQWIKVWNEISPEFAAERLLELEEESIVILCRRLFDIVPVGLENGQQDDDRFFRSDDGKFYLRVRDTDPETEEVLMGFMRSLFGVDMAMAGRVFAYAAMLVEAESHEDAERWRQGRLADAGFVTGAEALALTTPSRSGLSRWTSQALDQAAQAEAAVVVARGADDLAQSSEWLDRILAVFRTLPEQERAEHIRGLVSGQTLLAHFGDREPSAQVVLADEAVVVEAADRALRLALQKLSVLNRSKVLASGRQSSESLAIDAVMLALCEQDADAFHHYQGRLARMGNAIASLMGRPTGSEAQWRSLEILKHVINLGLEACALLPDGQTGLCVALRTWLLGEGASPVPGHEFHQLVFQKYGPETLFQIGLDLQAVATRLASSALDDRIARASPGAHPTLLALARSGRFADLRRAVTSLETELSGDESLLAHAFLGRFAMMPEGLHVVGSLRHRDLRAWYGKDANEGMRPGVALDAARRTVRPAGTLSDWLTSCLAAVTLLRKSTITEAVAMLWTQLDGNPQDFETSVFRACEGEDHA